MKTLDSLLTSLKLYAGRPNDRSTKHNLRTRPKRSLSLRYSFRGWSAYYGNIFLFVWLDVVKQYIACVGNSCIVSSMLSLQDVEKMFRIDINGFHFLYICCWILQYVLCNSEFHLA